MAGSSETNSRQKWSRIALFLLIAMGFSGGVAALIHKLGGLTTIWAGPLMLAYMCGPMIAAIICVLFFDRHRWKAALGFTGGFNLWLLWAWLIAVIIAFGATFISLLAPEVALQSFATGLEKTLIEAGQDTQALEGIPALNLILLLQAVLLGAAINTPLMLSEELGWRGWLWDKLRPDGFWPATFWIGLFWGIWHAPIIVMGYNYPGMPVSGPFLFIAFCMFYAVPYSYVREKNGSIWAPCVLHGTGNAVAGMAMLLQSDASMPWRGVVGIGGFIMLATIVLWVLWQRRRADAGAKA